MSILLPWLQGVIVYLTFSKQGQKEGIFKTVLSGFGEWNLLAV